VRARGNTLYIAALHLAVAVATGTPFLDRFAVPRGASVVYVAMERQRSNLRTRVAVIARGMGIEPESEQLANLHFAYKPRHVDLRDKAATAALCDALVAYGPALVIFDVLRRVAHVPESNEGVGAFSDVLRNLEPLAVAGCGVLFVHHNTKPNDQTKDRDPGERLSGSGSLFGHADYGIFITSKNQKARTVTISLYSRDDAEHDELDVTFAGNGTGKYGGFAYTDTCTIETGDEGDRLVQMDTRILAKVAQEPGVNSRDLEAAAGGRRATASERIEVLISGGLIRREKPGRERRRGRHHPLQPGVECADRWREA
jgi:hypothetical protein